jgi:hypothetical protein
MDRERVLHYLDVWKESYDRSKINIGFPSKSSGFMSGGIHSLEDWEDSVDYPAADVVDSAVRELPMLPKFALYVIYLGEKSTMNDMLLEQSYETAITMLQKKLREKNLY